MGRDLPAAPAARTDAAAERLFFEIMLDSASDDPYTGYRRLREAAPVLLTADGTLVLSGHAECDAALRHRSLGKGAEMLGFQVTEIPDDRLRPMMDQVRGSMVLVNPPDHTRLRRLVSSAFTGRHVEALRQAVTARTDRLLDRLAAEPGADFMTLVALPLPLNVIADLLGVPEADRAALVPWARTFGVMLSADNDAEALTRAGTAVAEFTGYLSDLLAHKRRVPGDDLLSRLAASHAADALDEEETISTAILLFGAGFETTTNLLGNGLHALIRHPEQLALLRREPGLIPTAVEELLRYDTPVQLDARTVMEPAVLAGTELVPGQMVITLLGAANHDPARFADPCRLDVTRADNPHLAFASGIHFCLGAHLARLEAHVVLQRLVTRFTTLALDGAPRRRPGLALRGYAHLPITTGATGRG
ncbi:cytochrome P450 [Actinomadura scrupuli]|uniref:cytochrome P450 n=1 Tax=Actinomadura scrupuli TaxID=559629 RepID=UPI003D9925F6